jgi:hypothetical protein
MCLRILRVGLFFEVAYILRKETGYECAISKHIGQKNKYFQYVVNRILCKVSLLRMQENCHIL